MECDQNVRDSTGDWNYSQTLENRMVFLVVTSVYNIGLLYQLTQFKVVCCRNTVERNTFFDNETFRGTHTSAAQCVQLFFFELLHSKSKRETTTTTTRKKEKRESVFLSFLSVILLLLLLLISYTISLSPSFFFFFNIVSLAPPQSHSLFRSHKTFSFLPSWPRNSGVRCRPFFEGFYFLFHFIFFFSYYFLPSWRLPWTIKKKNRRTPRK